jgi:hypothetical protein
MNTDLARLHDRIRALENSRERWRRVALVIAVSAVTAAVLALGSAGSRAVGAEQPLSGGRGVVGLEQLARRLTVLEANQRALAAAITLASLGRVPMLQPDGQGLYDAANALPALANAETVNYGRSVPQP